MKKIVFTIKESGHNLEYIHNIYEECLKMPDIDFVFVVPEKIKPYLKNFSWENSQNIIFDFIAVEDQERCLSHNILMNAFYTASYLKKKVKEHGAIEVFVITIMALMPFSGILIPARISGIVYGIYLYNWKRMSLLSKFLSIAKYKYLSNNKRYKRILILNDQVSTQYLNKKYHTQKFQFLPDPYVKIEANDELNFRETYNIPPQSVVFLHFGAIERRKGTLYIVSSIAELPHDIKDHCFFVFAGRIKDDIKTEFYEKVQRLNHKNILIIDDFCSYDTIVAMCKSSNAILMPYLEVDKSSGLLGYASQFSVPVIGSKDGLIGKLIRRYKLGVTCDPTSVDDLIINYKKVIDGKVLNPSDDYCKEHSVDQFKSVILSTLE